MDEQRNCKGWMEELQKVMNERMQGWKKGMIEK